ncbi:MAG: hypothetical protein V4615_00815 [Bacteroidota bacterium]
MKQLSVFLFSLFAFHLSLLAQQEIVSTATEFIVAKEYSAANRYLDSILKKNAKSVDALMMKGNVILNRAVENLPAINTITKNDESIFYPSIEQKQAVVLPIDTVRAIEKWWRKGLKMDSSRNDIRKGLCTVYAMGLVKEDLKKEIAALVGLEKNEDGEQAYRMAEYARKFKERGQFEDAMEVYQFIAVLYSDLAGLRCDIASEYFYEGRMNEALIWLDSCYNFKTVDETSFLNGAFIYSELGYFDDAQNVLNTYSNIYQRKMDKFYYGLRLFEESSEKYAQVLNEFIGEVDSNSYSTEVEVANKLLAFRDSLSLADFRMLADDQSIPDYYRVLILSRGVKQFANECGPFMRYGVYQSSIRNYTAAVQFLEEGELCEMNIEEKELWMLQYAYTLLMVGEQQKSLLYFKPLFASANSFLQQASKYFSAKILMEQKQNAEAEKFLKEIASLKEETKYATLAKRLMR